MNMKLSFRSRHSTTVPRVLLGVAVCLFAPAAIVALLALVLAGGPFSDGLAGFLAWTVFASLFATVLSVPGLLIWGLLHLTKQTNLTAFALVGLAFGLLAGLVFNPGDAQRLVIFPSAGVITGILLWFSAYAGRPEGGVEAE